MLDPLGAEHQATIFENPNERLVGIFKKQTGHRFDSLYK